MSYDLNILCVNQEKATTKLPKKIQIYAEPQNQKSTEYPKYYKDYCATMNAVNGIWYYLMSDKDRFSSFDLCDIKNVNDKYLKNLYSSWFENEEDLDVSVLCLREECRQEVWIP